jgi:hypothetical protein
MKHKLSALIGVIALSTAGMVAIPSVSSGQSLPSMGFPYSDVIPIPVNDSTTKAIAGALFKPAAGAGPFPAVIYIGGCAGPNGPTEMMLERTVIDHLLVKGVATLIVDPFTSRNEPNGICASVKKSQ